VPDHSAGLNAAADYIFSIIKKFHSRPDFPLPDRVQVSMTVPQRAYTEPLSLRAIGAGRPGDGRQLAAFIPSRRDPKVNVGRPSKVTASCASRVTARRHVGLPIPTWCAACARRGWLPSSGSVTIQPDRQRPNLGRRTRTTRTCAFPDGQITEAACAGSVERWHPAISNQSCAKPARRRSSMMDDAATAEISRLVRWIHHRDVVRMARAYARITDIADEELAKLA
jgi:malate synthase